MNASLALDFYNVIVNESIIIITGYEPQDSFGYALNANNNVVFFEGETYLISSMYTTKNTIVLNIKEHI